MRLHGNESLRRRRQREQKRREILNIVCSMIVVVAIVGTFFQTMVWAQTVPQPKNETSKQQTTLDQKIDVSYFRSHIDTAPKTVVASNEDYVSGIIRVYNDEICNTIDSYTNGAFYEPSYVIARAYKEGEF